MMVILSRESTVKINDIDPNHLFWLITNSLIFIAILAGIFIVYREIRKSSTLKTGAGPWVIFGLLFFIPSVVNEIFDELDIILGENFYPDDIYEIFFTVSPLLTLIGALLLIFGLYRQFLVGEILNQDLIKKNIELKAQSHELSNFANVLSHDLRNELAMIHATLDTMEMSSSANEADIEKMRKRVNQISSLITRSIELAETGQIVGNKKPMDLNSLVREVASVSIPSSVNFSIDNLPTIPADREKIYQVIKNIFENAVLHAQPKTIRVTSKTFDEYMILSFVNDGKPVADDLREKMFKQKLSEENGIGGLGLNIIQRIIEAHGWTINLNDHGLAFEIKIPRKE
ncbi:MAG: sensor histidine kinase [Candidatus Hodarchaeales archaeon]|jgi:signal transduction histidine kinase